MYQRVFGGFAATPKASQRGKTPFQTLHGVCNFELPQDGLATAVVANVASESAL